MSSSDPAPGGLRPRDDARIGTLLAERYRIDALLGAGGMGRVYAAEHVLMHKRLAVKVLHRELTSVPEVVARFEREAMAAANIDHPNVAAATDFGHLPDGCVFMVMEYVEGRNLRDEIAAGPLPVERAAAIARQIASALASAHALEIVHRDLKPENVMLVTKGADPDFVKVLDFGIARVPIAEAADRDSSPITRAGMVFGTPEYMAPEQALGQVVDGRADLYALGVIFYEMLSGMRPFAASSQTGVLGQQLSRAAPAFAERCPGLRVPHGIEQIVLRLLDREASGRFPAAAGVVTAIDAALGSVGGDAARIFTRIGGTVTAPFGGRPASSPDASRAAGLAALPAGVASGGLDEGAWRGVEALAPAAPRAGEAIAPLAAAGLAGVPGRAEPPPALRVAAQLLDWIDRRRLGLAPPLRDVPAPMYLGVAAALLLVITLGALRLAAPGDGGAVRQGVTVPASASAANVPTPASAASGAATPALAAGELEAAVRGGSEALAELASRRPGDARVELALAQALSAEGRLEASITALGRALGADPGLRTAPPVEAVVRKAIANPAARDEAFSLLLGPMGTRGADLVYSLATSEAGPSDLRARADELVRQPAFLERAAPALRVLARLRAARTCGDVAAVLDSARADGDVRALRFLRAYQETRGCKVKRKRVDCWPCLRGDRKLVEAIEAIVARAADAGAGP